MPKHDPVPVSPETHQRHRLATWASLLNQPKKEKTENNTESDRP